MARFRKMVISVLNVTTHPHSPDMYVRLFHRAATLKKPVKYLGDKHIIIGPPAAIIPGKFEEGFRGTIYRFIDIDTSNAWLDLNQVQEVVSEDGSPVVDIPVGLKPNCQYTQFVFFPKGHRLFFISKSHKILFSESCLANSLERLFSDERIFEEFGHVNVSAVSTKESILQILKIPDITSLTISVTLPNADDLSHLQQDIIDRMQQQNVNKQMSVMRGVKQDGIKPDDMTIAYMGVALDNGYVVAEGYSGEEKVIRKTADHPVKIPVTYDPEIETGILRLESVARAELPKLISRGIDD